MDILCTAKASRVDGNRAPALRNIYIYILDGLHDDPIQSLSDDEGANTNAEPSVSTVVQQAEEAEEAKDMDFDDVNIELMPACMQVGIPHAIDAADSEWMWHILEEDLLTKRLPHSMSYRGQNTTAARDIINTMTRKQPGVNARQIIAFCRHDEQKLELPTPDFCPSHPPPEPNVYSDGSLKHPRLAHWSLGGFGVWWPGRQKVTKPLTQGEEDVATHHQTDMGLKMWGCITGQKASSTRAELAAGILAIQGPGAIHQGTDSKSYMAGARNILERKTKRKQKPWSLRPDGDLWQLWEKTAIAKGIHAIRISWFKGHATQEHIEREIATAESKEGNDIADAVAELGVRTSHQTGLLQLAGYYAGKQKKLLQLTQRIHRMILRVLKAEHHERTQRIKRANAEAKVQGAKHNHITIPTDTDDPPLTEGRSLDLSKPNTTGLEGTDLVIHLQMWAFFNNTRWTRVEGQNNGTSWIEMLARYQLLGGKLTANEVDAHPFAASLSFRQAIITFRRLANRIIHVYAPEHSVWLFKPAKASAPRLQKYGCTTHVPCVVGQMCHDGHSRTTLRNTLATITIGYAKMHKAEEGQTPLTTKPTNITYRGPPPWLKLCNNDHLSQVASRSLPRDDEESREQRTTSETEPARLKITCCCCGANKCQTSRLVCKGTWVPVWCPACKRTSTAKNWQCECGAPWHKCQTHAVTGFKLKRTPSRTMRHSIKKAKIGLLGDSNKTYKRSSLKKASGEPDGTTWARGNGPRSQIQKASVGVVDAGDAHHPRQHDERDSSAHQHTSYAQGPKRCSPDQLQDEPRPKAPKHGTSSSTGVRGIKRKATYDLSQPVRLMANILATNPRLAARLAKSQTARPPGPT